MALIKIMDWDANHSSQMRKLWQFSVFWGLGSILFLSSGALLPLLRGGVSSAEYFAEGDPVQRQLWIVIYILALGISILCVSQLFDVLGKTIHVVFLHLLAATSVLWSIDPSLSARRATALIFTGLIGALLAVVLQEQLAFDLIAWVMALTSILSLFIILSFPDFGISDDLHSQGDWMGAYANKNRLGVAMALTLVIWLLRLRNGRGSKLVAIIVLSVTVLLLLGSNSQTSIVSATITCLVIMAMPLMRRINLAGIGLSLIACGLAVPAALNWWAHDFDSLLTSLDRDTTFTGRTKIWEGAWFFVSQKPLLGFGFGSFWRGIIGPSGDVAMNYTRGFMPVTAHNGLLELGLGLGLVGITLFAMIFAFVVIRAVRRLRVSGGLEAEFPASFLLFYAIYNIAESNFLEYHSIFWIIFVFLACRLALDQKSHLLVAA